MEIWDAQLTKKEIHKLICGEAEVQIPLALCLHEEDQITVENKEKKSKYFIILKFLHENILVLNGVELFISLESGTVGVAGWHLATSRG